MNFFLIAPGYSIFHYYGEHNELSVDKRNKMDPKYKPEEFNYDGWSENEESSDTTRKSDKKESSDTTTTDEKSTDLPPMPPLEVDEEEVKEEK